MRIITLRFTTASRCSSFSVAQRFALMLSGIGPPPWAASGVVPSARPATSMSVRMVDRDMGHSGTVDRAGTMVPVRETCVWARSLDSRAITACQGMTDRWPVSNGRSLP